MNDLAPLPRLGGINVAKQPAFSYLANLRESGRRTMKTALDTCAGILGSDHFRLCPWHMLRYEHTSALRAILAARYAPATVNKHLTAVRGVLKACWRAGVMDGEDYRRAIDVPNVKGSSLPAGRMVPEEELRKLWEAADAMTPRYSACLALLFSAGLRREEAAAVAFEDVSFEVGADGSDTCWVRLVGKGGKERRVPVRGTACCRLRVQLHTSCQPLAGGARFSFDGSHFERLERTLLGVKGGRSVAKLLAHIVKAAGIPHASCHDLRRSFVSHALANGAELAIVARMAGHSDPRTTARYDRRPDQAMEEVADALPQ